MSAGLARGAGAARGARGLGAAESAAERLVFIERRAAVAARSSQGRIERIEHAEHSHTPTLVVELCVSDVCSDTEPRGRREQSPQPHPGESKGGREEEGAARSLEGYD